MSRTRYPGLNYFRPEDEPVFCGREKEREQLYTKLMLYSTLVLHAESGAGKSSLIQAGLLPRLERELRRHLESPDPNGQAPYLPVVIRLDSLTRQPTPSFLIDETLVRIRQAMEQVWQGRDPDQLALPYLEGEEPNLWLIAKKLYAQHGVRLLLVFDQFEEIQACKQDQIETFSAGLLDLLSVRPPGFVTEAIDRKTDELLEQASPGPEEQAELNKNIRLLEGTLGAKAVFVVREDKLGVMSLINDRFPDILKNDFTLAGLDLNSARAAIIKPGLAPGDFISPLLYFDEAIVDNILRQILDQGKRAETGTKEAPRQGPDETPLNHNIRIDPLQLQIVCSDIARKIVAGLAGNRVASVVITGEHINTMSSVVEDYYTDVWKTAKDALVPHRLNEAAFDSKRREIIAELVVADRRDMVHEARLLGHSDEATDREILAILTGKGGKKLLNSIKSGGEDTFYQLCHDRFVQPVVNDGVRIDAQTKAKAEKKRAVQKTKRISRRILMMVVLAASLAVYYYYDIYESRNRQLTRAIISYDKDTSKLLGDIKYLSSDTGVLRTDLVHQKALIDSIQGLLDIKLDNALLQVKVDSLLKKALLFNDDSLTSVSQMNNALHYDNDSLAKVVKDLNTQLLQNQRIIAQLDSMLPERRSTNYTSLTKIDSLQQVVDFQSANDQASKIYSSWFKAGYFLQFGDIKISLLAISKEEQNANICICQTQYKGVCSVMIEANRLIQKGKSYSFNNGGYRYTVKLDRIGNEGYDFVKPAADITLVRNKN